MNKSLVSKLIEARLEFDGTKYEPTVKKAWELVYGKTIDEAKAKEILDSLPTTDQLLEQLVKKLEGKRIHETIKKIVNNSLKESDVLVAKGLSSLLTHTIIEVESGNLEYRKLVPVIQERLNEAIYNSILKRGKI